jgi:Tol biopolymer transport system component
VVQISPERNARDVSSAQPIHIRFDRAVDGRSVATRFHLTPSVKGQIRWPSDRELVFEHPPLHPGTSYQVVLDSGYQDRQGTVNSLRHSWSFTTEAPPLLTGSSPGGGDQGVDPASYLSLSFSREMDVGSLARSIGVSPSLRFSLREDPSEPRRVILAPDALLDPNVSYTVTVTQDARDVDGNQLRAGSVVTFTTGQLRSLKHWVGFIAEPTTGAGGDGVWIVDENRFPRRVVTAPVDQFSWSQDATHLLLRSPAGGWSDQPLNGTATILPFHAEWAAFLAGGRGYAYLEQGSLKVLSANGAVLDVASDVGHAAVAPNGTRLAFAIKGRPGSEIYGYDVDLRARYRLQVESGPVDQLAWSPDGQALAYRLQAQDPQKSQIRARQLNGAARTLTVATGDVSGPAWQADSRHLVFRATVAGSSGSANKAFRLAVGDPPPRNLSVGQGLPAASDLSVQQVSLSHDGHQIAFLADFQGRPAVWLMNADGTGLTRLSAFDPAGSYSSRALAWTPT